MKVFHEFVLVFALATSSLTLGGDWWPAADEQGTVYTVDSGAVQALTTGGVKWRKFLDSIGQVLIAEDLLLVPSIYHSVPMRPGEPNIYYISLYALKKNDGSEKWTVHWQRDGSKETPLAYSGAAYDGYGHVLYDGLTLDLKTGAMLTNSAKFFASADGIDLPAERYRYSRAIGRDGTFYEGLDSAVRARDHRTAVQKWQTRLFGAVGEPVLGEDETVYVSDDTGTLYALDHLTGEILWRNEVLYDRLYEQSNRRSATIALASNQVAVLRYLPVFATNGAIMDLKSTLQTLDGVSGSVVGIFTTNFNPSSLPYDAELFRARPMIVIPQGAVYIKDRGWLSGQFAYGKSTWPRPSARNDNAASLARSGVPLIIGQPEPASVTNGKAVFSVYASGTFPLSYQWFKNGEIIPGATNAVLAAEAVAMADAYQVKVSNPVGEAMSAQASPGFTVRAEVQGGRVFVEPKLAAYPLGSTVTLRAESWNHRAFAGWSGSFASTNNPLSVTVTSNLHFTALFQHEKLDLLGLHTLASPASAGRAAIGTNGILYLPTSAGVFAFDPVQKRELWLAGVSAAQVAVSPKGNILCAGPFTLYSLNSSNGTILWQKPLSISSLAIDPDGTIFTFGTNVASFTPAGVELWSRKDISNASGGGFIGPDGRLFVSAGSEILGLARNTGATVWRCAGSFVVPGPLNRLIVWSNGWSTATLFLVNRETGEAVVTRTYPPVSTWDAYPLISSSGRTLLISRNGGGGGDIAEWDPGDNSIFPLRRSSLKYGAVLAGSKQAVVQGERLELYDMEARSTAGYDSWPITGNISSPLITVLPDGRIARLLDPGYLLLHANEEPPVQTMSVSPGITPQNTRCLLKPGPPRIITQPQDQLFVLGGSCSFAVDATGTPNLSFQWYRGSNLISGATGPELRISRLTEADRNAEFSVVISNAEGSARSVAAGFTYRIKTIADGPGMVQQESSLTRPRIGDLVTFRAISTERPFLHWAGSLQSTNDVISLRLESNLVLRAVFDSRPGDLRWEVPLTPELAAGLDRFAGLPIHFSEERPEALLPGFVRLDLNDLTATSLTPLPPLTRVSTGQRGESIRAFTQYEYTNLLVKFDFGSSLVRTAAFPHAFGIPAIDEKTNLYAMASSGLFKLTPGGDVIWTNALPNLSRNEWRPGAVRIGSENFGAVFGYNLLIIFNTETGAVLHEIPTDLSDAIFVSGPRLIASSSRSNQVFAMDPRNASLLWSNSNSGLFVADDRSLYSADERSIAAMDIESGATRWKAVFPDLCCFTNLFLSKDQLIYATSDRNILCLAARDGTKVWSATVPPGSGRFPGLGNLGPDGTLYRFSYAKTLMAYKTSAGLADSEWPEPTGLGNSFATTPPKPIAPVVISIRRSELGAVLEFYGQARARYILEKCADLAASNWQSVTSVPGENAPIQLPVELDSKEQFYRLKTNRD